MKPLEAREEVLRVIAEVARIEFARLSEHVREFDMLRPTKKSESADMSGERYGQRLKQARLALVKAWLAREELQ